MSEISIKELNEQIQLKLINEFNNIKIIGEISNMKISNGHLYMTLKDAESSINVIMWQYTIKNKTMNLQLNNGDNLIVEGSLNVYVKCGTYNIIINNIIKNGIGNLHKMYELNKLKYENLGYFNNKKNQPKIFYNIGILTAIDSAALQDILFVLNNNNFKGNIYIKNCTVQGTNCPLSIASGIDFFEKNQNKYNLDVLLITRGGGSFEDLIGFSDELVIESIKQSTLYIISAIGHEIDFMLSDFVADLRAPTPSIAGQIISCRWKQLNNEIKTYNTLLNNNKIRINQLINKSIEELDNIKNNIKSELYVKINQYKQKIENIDFQIDNLNFKNILNKGYTIIMDDMYNIIDDIKDINIGQKLNIKCNNGEINVIVNNINKHG
jgi:exodeoxyribonuclease VII large subunit